MTWLKVDDRFAWHRKVRQAGTAPLGLWIRCAALSAADETDGHVLADDVRGFGGRPRDIAALVDAGLWVPTNDGYLIHDFLDYNPSREQSAAKRAAGAERQHRHRESRRD